MFTQLKRPFAIVDRQIDKIGMYRVVTLALLVLVIWSFLTALFGWLPYSVAELAVSLVVAVTVGMVSNWLLAKVWGVHTNHESALITALIIFFLVLPAQLSQLEQSFIVGLVAVLAMVSKYVLVWRKQHILNPVATGAVVTALVYAVYPLPPGYFETSWWIGQPILFIPLVLVGSAVVHKVRKWTPVLAFLTVGFLVFLYEEWQAVVYFEDIQYTGWFDTEKLTDFIAVSSERWTYFWLSGPSIFLAAFMLTEPFTMPPTKRIQGWYGALVGFVSQMWIPGIKMTPELALIIGNAAVYPWRLRRKLFLSLQERTQIADATYEFVFKKPTGLQFEPGQYLEWMLPHERSDSRGVRRYFTIASAPTESVVRLALKVPEAGSTYKQALMQLDAGQSIIASQLAGDFLLPKTTDAKLAFIAGGIGITPFRSHVQCMLDTDRRYDTTLFYCCNTVGELAYHEFFTSAAAQMTFELVPVIAHEAVSAPYEHGFITADVILRRTPDYKDRTWYISGPPPMVHLYKKLLTEIGVPTRQIKTDFFPGLA